MTKPSNSNLREPKDKAICLALVAGYVDAYAFRVFGNFVSFMSGNTTFAGIYAGQGHLIAVLPPVLAIIGFLAGSFTGSWLIHSEIRSSQRLLFSAAAILLGSLVCLSLRVQLNQNVALPILGAAMGILNPAVSRVGGEPINLTFVTGTLNKIGGHLALAVRHTKPVDAEGSWDTHLHRAFLETSVWAGFFAGAILSTVARRFGVLELIPPSLALIAFALVSNSGRMALSQGQPQL